MSHSPSPQHLLSLAGEVLVLETRRAAAGRGAAARAARSLLFSRHAFSREENAFVKASDGAAVIGGGGAAAAAAASAAAGSQQHVDVVKCERALNARRRAAAPCVLVSQRADGAEGVRYSLRTLCCSSGSLEPDLEFELPGPIAEDVFILRGPAALWGHAGSVFCASPRGAEVRRLPLRLSHLVVGELPHRRGDQAFVLGLAEGRTLGCLVESGRVFDGDALLPPPYVAVTRCISVLSAERAEGDGRPLGCSLVAATRHQQLVRFEGGVARATCQLPFREQPERVQQVDAGRHGGLLVVSSQWGHVCAVWRDSFTLAAQWSGVGSVHVDDFLGCGSDQMLLVFEGDGTASSSRRPLERFLLTDLCGISYSVRPPVVFRFSLCFAAIHAVGSCHQTCDARLSVSRQKTKARVLHSERTTSSPSERWSLGCRAG